MPSVFDRCEFIASSLALAASSAAAGGERLAMPIIDTHQHLRDLKKFRLPWIAKGTKLDRSYVMSDAERAARFGAGAGTIAGSVIGGWAGGSLGAVQTVKRRGGRVLDYLTEAINAYRHDLPAPAVLAPH